MRKFATKTTTAVETIVDIAGNNQIWIFTLKLQLTGAAANTVTIQDGSDIIDKYLLATTGQVEGIATERPAYVLNDSLKLTCSGTDPVNIFVDYEIL